MLSLKNNKKGFTIIEVLIVLAVAGAIMMVVFLAVPALQRNSRNTQRRNDVARLGGAMTEFTQNNNGNLPTTAIQKTTIVTSAGTLSQYTDANIFLRTGVQGAVADTATMNIVTGAKCDTVNLGATLIGTARQVAIQYMVEDSGSGTGACQEV
jgi:prepilin-type N-terminal cleavage/methylation domain-containing protein